MPLRSIHVKGYRSVRDLSLDLREVNVLTGPNGCGKSNLYNSLVLLARAARGEFARAMAEEGGTPSVFWAGGERVRYTRKKAPKRIVLGFENDDYGYELQAGLPSLNEHALGTMFTLDPRVKEERIWPAGSNGRTLMLKRDEPSAWLRNADGNMVTYPLTIEKQESVLSQIINPHQYPEISVMRNEMLGWRFYHHFRTDAESPLRQPQIGVYTPVLNADGSDLAAALQTVIEIGDEATLRDTVCEALGGAQLQIDSVETQFSLSLRIPGLLRPLHSREFSDGQLRLLCLCAALLSPRPPKLMALNEPETSLHPDLIDTVGKLIAGASKHSQLWITTHSMPLAESIERHSGVPRIQLQLVGGETSLVAASF